MMKAENVDILCLQETHLQDQNVRYLKEIFMATTGTWGYRPVEEGLWLVSPKNCLGCVNKNWSIRPIRSLDVYPQWTAAEFLERNIFIVRSMSEYLYDIIRGFECNS